MLEVTPRAQEKLGEAMDTFGMPGALVRIRVVRGPHGCVHGWRMALEEEEEPGDTVVQAGEVRLLVGPEEAGMLQGAVLDYREEAGEAGFTLEAPNAPPPRHHQGEGCHHHG